MIDTTEEPDIGQALSTVKSAAYAWSAENANATNNDPTG